MTSKKEERHTLMLVSPIEEKVGIEGLSRSGETEKAQEEEREERSMLDCCPASMEEGEEEEGETEESCEGRKSAGRKSPTEPTKV